MEDKIGTEWWGPLAGEKGVVGTMSSDTDTNASTSTDSDTDTLHRRRFFGDDGLAAYEVNCDNEFINEASLTLTDGEDATYINFHHPDRREGLMSFINALVEMVNWIDAHPDDDADEPVDQDPPVDGRDGGSGDPGDGDSDEPVLDDGR